MISDISDWKSLAARINYLNIYASQGFLDNPQVKKDVLWALVERTRGLPVSDETPQIQRALSFIEEKGAALYGKSPIFVCEYDDSKIPSGKILQRL